IDSAMSLSNVEIFCFFVCKQKISLNKKSIPKYSPKMEQFLDTLSNIISYMFPESISKLIPSIPSLLDYVGKNNMFWKGLVEILIERYIDYEDIDWKSIYLNLNKLLVEFKFNYNQAF